MSVPLLVSLPLQFPHLAISGVSSLCVLSPRVWFCRQYSIAGGEQGSYLLIISIYIHKVAFRPSVVRLSGCVQFFTSSIYIKLYLWMGPEFATMVNRLPVTQHIAPFSVCSPLSVTSPSVPPSRYLRGFKSVCVVTSSLILQAIQHCRWWARFILFECKVVIYILNHIAMLCGRAW